MEVVDNLKKIYKYGRGKNYLFLLALILAVFMSVLGVTVVKYSQEMIDSALGKEFLNFVYALKIGALIYMLRSFLDFLHYMIVVKYMLGLDVDIKAAVFKSLMFSTNRAYSVYHSGELITVIDNDIDRAIIGIFGIIDQIITNITLLVVSIIYLVSLNWILTFVCLIFALSTLLMGRIADRPISASSEKTQAALADANAYSQDVLMNVDIIKSYTYTEKAMERFAAYWNKYLKYYMYNRLLKALYGVLTAFINRGFYILLYALGGIYIIKGTISVGMFTAFIVLSENISGTMERLFSSWTDLIKVNVSARRFFEALNIPQEQDDTSNYKDSGAESDLLRFDNVWFGYSSEKPVLKGVSFSVKAGEKVAIVGPSGSGKSTVLSLILRFYEPDNGNIYYKGKNLRNYDYKELRDELAVVLQDTAVFTGTIMDNLKLVKPDATGEEIDRAVKAAGLYDFIMSLPQGYQTTIGEKGMQLSGGQRQRLGIARAFLKDAKVIMLDEATAALDANAEYQLYQALNKISANKAVIAISHRLSFVKDYDRIIVLQDGNIVEQGSHMQLINTDGLYARMYGLNTLDENLA
ncbi:ATP-binding cassette, subfamily B [Caldanaerobius fijiensis DSM 17918]|uniref:ATP-binding cassette, subfamily B n=1 Tax=Caldanaerobius fijiensis DSM 17918 TaxID=1121256 RepID=A0A1M4VFC3_9THEO|nr:ABC transporter ATP-binding protein [Caldanaerobius fijiensis]SHE67659.1 ATP-binding cassette, subfamily B [Caldanaerobius fijiensis DSM 17918]